VSLILDALRKLEREKKAGEPGVVVVQSVAWAGPSRTRRALGFAIVALAVIALATAGTFLLLRGPAGSRSHGTGAGGVPEHRPKPAASAAVTPVPLSAEPAQPQGGRARPAATDAAPPPGRRLEIPTTASSPATSPPPAAPADDLRLNAISQRDGRPVALINDRLVFEGDSFDGVRVLRIGETEVEVEVRGQRRVLRF
jgi:hypothetical protein